MTEDIIQKTQIDSMNRLDELFKEVESMGGDRSRKLTSAIICLQLDYYNLLKIIREQQIEIRTLVEQMSKIVLKKKTEEKIKI